jgi:hypothetical protein
MRGTDEIDHAPVTRTGDCENKCLSRPQCELLRRVRSRRHARKHCLRLQHGDTGENRHFSGSGTQGRAIWPGVGFGEHPGEPFCRCEPGGDLGNVGTTFGIEPRFAQSRLSADRLKRAGQRQQNEGYRGDREHDAREAAAHSARDSRPRHARVSFSDDDPVQFNDWLVSTLWRASLIGNPPPRARNRAATASCKT